MSSVNPTAYGRWLDTWRQVAPALTPLTWTNAHLIGPVRQHGVPRALRGLWPRGVHRSDGELCRQGRSVCELATRARVGQRLRRSAGSQCLDGCGALECVLRLCRGGGSRAPDRAPCRERVQCLVCLGQWAASVGPEDARPAKLGADQGHGLVEARCQPRAVQGAVHQMALGSGLPARGLWCGGGLWWIRWSR